MRIFQYMFQLGIYFFFLCCLVYDDHLGGSLGAQLGDMTPLCISILDNGDCPHILKSVQLLPERR